MMSALYIVETNMYPENSLFRTFRNIVWQKIIKIRRISATKGQEIHWSARNNVCGHFAVQLPQVSYVINWSSFSICLQRFTTPKGQ